MLISHRIRLSGRDTIFGIPDELYSFIEERSIEYCEYIRRYEDQALPQD